jgi:ribosome-binding protein aMBF1 (putative translation factor)
LLGWSSKTLAARAHVGTSTVLRIERARNSSTGQCHTLEKLEMALREGGVEFEEGDNLHGRGVHFQQSHGSQ